MSAHDGQLPTVIVPVFNGTQVLKPCFDSLLRTLPDEACVHVVDDASPDPAVAPLIDAFVRDARCRTGVTRHSRNLGFVETVNRAMAGASGNVVLLNSDTLTTPGWLQALARCAGSDPSIATATPWSNNAEICSVPEFCKSNPVPADVDRVAEAVARTATGPYPDLPTGVGFCMLIRRAVLIALGSFDFATFGRGYGEENDFCRRAAGHGWRNVLCHDAYVAHVGHASFANENLAPGGVNQQRLEARYPHYAGLVASFIANDPLAPLRARIAQGLDIASTRSEAA